jgi:uncharacterized coiled-coil protein SlyX
MKRSLYFLLVCCLLAGCSSNHDGVERGPAGANAPSIEQKDERNQYLAYEHTISVQTDESGVKALYEKIVASCAADKDSGCSLLDSRLDTGQYASGNIKMRAKREGIKNLIGIAASGGKVLDQNTRVEDLARPIVESNKRIDMLQQYQKRLLELEHRPNNDVDSLIKLSKELAATQSELETASGENAKLLERVNMDILQISIGTDARRSFWPPIREAGSAFFSNLSNGISSTITAMAYILPWAVVIFIFGWIVRKLWRRRKV